jgi:hypothetical protein
MPRQGGYDHRMTHPPPSPALLAAVARAGPVKTRRPGRATGGIALLSLASALSVLVWGLGLRRGVGAIPRLPLLLYTAVCLAAFAGQLAAALIPPSGEVLPSGQRSSRMSLVSLAITVPVGILVGIQTHPGVRSAVGHLAGFWTQAVPCLVNGMAVAAVPALLGFLSLRRLVPGVSRGAARALGGAGGVLAGLTLELHCPHQDLVHVGLAHGSVMLVPALVLALLGVRLLAD